MPIKTPNPKSKFNGIWRLLIVVRIFKYQLYDRLDLTPNLTAIERREIQERQTEIRWTLAALWFSPPMASSRTVAAWLREFDLVEIVEPMKQQLAR